MTLERQVRTIALRNALVGGDEMYHLRKRCRWYSRTFYTPLHVVEQEIPLLHVLRAYWEHTYEQLRDSDDPADVENLAQERQLLSMTPEEWAAARAEEDSADADAEKALGRIVADHDEDDPSGMPGDVGLPEDVTIDFAPKPGLLDNFDPESFEE